MTRGSFLAIIGAVFAAPFVTLNEKKELPPELSPDPEWEDLELGRVWDDTDLPRNDKWIPLSKDGETWYLDKGWWREKAGHERWEEWLL